MRRPPYIFAILCALNASLQGAALSTLRSDARSAGLAEAGAAARPGAAQGMENPGALSATGRTFWFEAGDSAGLRQQRAGAALFKGAWVGSLDLGVDSILGLQRRDANGALLGVEDLSAPWAIVALARPTAWGRWGLGLGARDRSWFAAGVAPEFGLGWSGGHSVVLGLDLWRRDEATQAQASLAWNPAGDRFGLEGGYIAEGVESRAGVGAQWKLWQGLALRLGWSRWLQFENERWSLGLGWDSGSTQASYAWSPGSGPGSSQKVGVQVSLAPTATPPATPTPAMSFTPTPSPTLTVTPSPTEFIPSPTFSPTVTKKAAVKEIEMHFILPK